MQYTQEQILKLAPDSASANAGSKLATQSKWVARHAHKDALWGDCQGSGKKPYKTSIDLQNLAFKCSCPSRKFPCKHSIGLFLLYARSPHLFTQEENLSEAVAEWLNKRNNRAASTKAKKNKPIDKAAQQKRIDAREKKIQGGIEELQIWLQDIIRTGLMNTPSNKYQFTKNIVARMVDSQAPGLANQLRQINSINFHEEGWQKTFLKHLSKIYALTEAYQNLAQLPEDLQEDIKSLIGWNIPKEQVLAQKPIADSWLVCSKIVEEEDNFSVERTWLYGIQNKRFAMLLDFYGFQQKPANLIVEGTCLEAKLCFYPSITPLRAIIKDTSEATKFDADLTIEGKNILDAETYISEQLTKQPFLTEHPLVLEDVSISLTEGKLGLIDAQESYLPIQNNSETFWQILALSQGDAFTCFGIYEEGYFQVHAVITQQKFYFVL